VGVSKKHGERDEPKILNQKQMNSPPTRKHSSELTKLTKVDSKDLEAGKFYYIRIRNKDKGPDVWGIKEDFIGKIHKIDGDGISFDYSFIRNADPRHGASVWKKAGEYNRVFVLAESLNHKNMDDNTTFYIDKKQAPIHKNGTRKKGKPIMNLRKLFGFFSRKAK